MLITHIAPARVKEHECGLDVKAGMVVSHDLDMNNLLVPALANGQLWRTAGIATHDAKKGEVVTVLFEGAGEFPAGTFEAGYFYYASPTQAGLLVKSEDFQAGHLAMVGYALSDSVLEVVNLQVRKVSIRSVKVEPVVAAVKPSAKG